MKEKPFVLVVSVSVIEDDKVLLIKESTSMIKDQWNFPSGRIEAGEDILSAAKREMKEETGLDVELTGTTGVYNFISSSQDQVFLFHFIGRIIEGSICLEEEGIIDSNWVTVSDLLNFGDDALRNPSVMKQIVGSLLTEDFYPVDLFQKQLK